VPYGPGFEIPLWFVHDGHGLFGRGRFNWTLTVLAIGGRPQRIGFGCGRGLDSVHPVTPEVLHRFPLGRYLEDAILMVSRPTEEIPRTFKRWKSPDEARAAHAAVAAHHQKRPDGHRRQRLTEDFLAEVAEVYRRHVTKGKPSKAVAEHFHYTDA